ncbi:hypothetical protein [Streptomyces sp. NPDC056191]|uniref:competence protein CoiA family protein n=1 Tax=Streptomyces sp. NPDC056191 TaxID=3345742 RepID=UPI0035D9EF99
MAFRAVHARWGPVLAHLPDLGCGRDWPEVWRVRPRAPLRCDECNHPMHAIVSRNGMRFFAHAPGAPKCALAQESAEHHLLKLELAAAARDAGAHAELEVRGPDDVWRADVLASDPAGAWRVALEAQLSPITADDISARTARMLKDGVSSVWFSDRVRVPWFVVVPWARVRTAERGGLVVIEGLSRFPNGHWEQGPPAVPAAEFLRWVFGDRVVAHQRRAAGRSPLAARHILWTPPRYAELEVAHLAELEAKERRKQEELRLRQEKDRIALETRRAALLPVPQLLRPGRLLFGFFAAMAETELENIREATLEGLDTAARKGNHGGWPPFITDDMLHTVLRRRANGETVEDIQPDLIIPIGKRRQSPSLSSIYRALAEHEKTQAYPEAVATAHADFAAVQQRDRSPK